VSGSADTLLRRMFAAAVDAAAPAKVLAKVLAANLPAAPKGRVLVLGAGKASAAMAAAVEQAWPDVDLSGLVVTRYGHGADCRRIAVVEASHPEPDQAGQAAAERILGLARAAGPDDLVLCLISGGGSALLSLPAEGLSLGDKQAVNRALLRSGASIGEINTVRKHISAIKGGRLALAAWPAPVLTLAISDVPGDDPAMIASGPTVADPTTRDEALAVLERYAITQPAVVLDHLRRPESETPKPGDPRLAAGRTVLIATPMASLKAASELAKAQGLRPVILGDAIEGEAREVAREMAAQALRIAGGDPAALPCVLISGGETSVTVRGRGRGGRNSEFLLALALALDGAPAIRAIACDTDGIDGVEDNAGAVVGPETLARAEALGIDPAMRLADNDAYAVFSALGDLVTTGPTRTNVNDFRAILIERPSPG
jgi:hydroxypyruvate reductase